MEPVLQQWNVVIAGAWNVAIFSPPWVGQRYKKLFGTKQVLIELRLTSEGTQIRFSDDHLILLPAPNLLTIGFKDLLESTVSDAEKMARHVLQELPHTPITGFGINFGFLEKAPSKEILALFRRENGGWWSNYQIETTTFARAIRVEDAVLNATLTLEDETQELNVNLNFHHAMTDCGKAAELLRNRMRRCKTLAATFLSEAYGLTTKKKRKKH